MTVNTLITDQALIEGEGEPEQIVECEVKMSSEFRFPGKGASVGADSPLSAHLLLLYY